MEEEKIIRLDESVLDSCRHLHSLDELNEFQEDIKSLAQEDGEVLKNSFKKNGFNMPFFIWKDLNDNLNLLDGHQRKKALEELFADGWVLPEKYPVIYVTASNKEEAKKKVLSYISQVGRINKDKLYDYMVNNNISIEELKFDYVIPELPIVPFEAEYFSEELTPLENVDIEGEIPNKNMSYIVVNFGDIDEYTEFSDRTRFKGKSIDYVDLLELIEKNKLLEYKKFDE